MISGKRNCILVQAEQLSIPQQRQLYELCWEFEESWIRGERSQVEDWLPRIQGLPAKVVLAELTEIQRELEQQWSQESRAAPPIEDPRYLFLEEIARGGAAVVWRVQDKHLQRETAIKFLLDSRDNRDMRARLEREARLCARLVHPGIVPIHELSSFADQRPFVSMKLVKGQTLLQWLQSDSPPSLRAALETFCKVCEAMAFAHEQGIIHRDLKPSNIMVGSFGEVQIMDWGLAKELDTGHGLESEYFSLPEGHSGAAPPAISECDNQTSNVVPSETTLIGSVCGTLAYMAPEQAQGRIDCVDRRSDVFALGGVLCRLLTGVAPYQASSHATLLQNAQAGNLRDAFQRLAAVRQRKWAKLAQQCLSVEREDRPADARELVARLTEIQRESRKTTPALSVAIAAPVVVCLLIGWFLLERKPWIAERPRFAEPSALPRDATPLANTFLSANELKDLLQSNQAHSVLKDYRSILEHYSSDAELYRLICIALMNAQRFEEAEQVIRQVLMLDPKHPEYHYLLCDTLVCQGKLAAASSAIQRSLECRDAGRPTAIHLEAKAAKVQKYTAIAQALARGPLPDPEQISGHELREIAYVCEITGQYAGAEDYYKLALDKDADLTSRSLLRHQLIGGFLYRNLCCKTLALEHRKKLARLALEWTQDQFDFAMVSLQDPQATTTSKTLMACLQHNPELAFLRELANDTQIDSLTRHELGQLLEDIDRAPAL